MANKNRQGNTQSSNSDKSAQQRSGADGKGNSRSANSGADSASTNGREHKGLKRLFEHQLSDLYYVEKQLLQHLPKMAEAAQNDELKQAFKDHVKETEGHVKHLEAIFKEIGQTPKAQKCDGIEGILKEGQQLMQEFKGDDALDAALVCAAQKVEHYEITSYGSLCAFAEQLGMDNACDRLEEILDQEKAADDLLSRLAESTLDLEAEEGSDDEEDQDGQDEQGSTATRTARATA
jgi:ferritin-like metal-binding protein YciE